MPDLTFPHPPRGQRSPSKLSPAVRRPGRNPLAAGQRAGRKPVNRGPLPDAVAIDAIAVPDPAPPFDDAPARPSPRRRAPGRRGAAPVERAAAEHPFPGAAEHPWPSQFAQVLAETLAGSRPARQITPWTTEQTRKRISQLGPTLATVQRPRLRRVIVTSPARDVLEMAIIVGLGPRVHAVAVRLERKPEPPAPARWFCTEVEAA